MAALDHVHWEFPVIADAIVQELKDQRIHLKLIASENFSSLAVQFAMGNLLTDKYAEGYPSHASMRAATMSTLIEAAAIDEVKKFLIATMPMFSPIRAPMPIWSLSGRSSSTACKIKKSEQLGKKSYR